MTVPDTLSVGLAITAYLQALTYPGGALVYKIAQLEAIKDVIDFTSSGGACAEVYGNMDDSQHHAFNGRVCDDQSWFVLSMCSLDTPILARQIYLVRDAVVQPFQTHATLGNAGNVFHAQIKPGSGRFYRIFRNGQWLRAHVIEVLTKSIWQVPGVIS